MTAPASLHGVKLCCPRDGAVLQDGLRCDVCGTVYPVVGGVPVLINDANSVFAVSDYLQGAGYVGPSYGRDGDGAGGLRRIWRRWARRLGDAPSSLRHPSAADALACVARRVVAPRVLVIGSGGVRLGAEGVLHTDVAFGPAVDAIADAHDLPFPPGSFDLVVAVAVLEHVAEPTRCVAEIARVLKPGGHVYAVTPFLQPVHMGAHDFTRFTPIGHRRLFRAFDEVAAGIAMGAGSVAAWSLGGVLMSVSARPAWRRMARAAGLLCTPPLRLLDRWLPAAADHAGGCWFFGRLREGAPVSDRALVAQYRVAPGVVVLR